MKKKIITLMLVSVMAVNVMSGCGYATPGTANVIAQVMAIEEEVETMQAEDYYEKGRACLYGTAGDGINLESAYAYFVKAKESGIRDANFYLGLLCDWYNYPEQNFEMAKTYYEGCIDNPYAQVALACLYYSGEGVEEDAAKAEELFQGVIDQGYVEGYLGKARILYDEGEYAAALENFIKVLDGTEQVFAASAMNAVGTLYKYGDGVEQDYEEALNWFGVAAYFGNAEAMNNIGYAYAHGEGIERDYEAAKAWYEMAASLGNAAAMNNIGYLYDHGAGVKQDYTKAKEWYERAADLGSDSAMHNLGYLYLYVFGEPEERDYDKAKEWYEKAADLENANAMLGIGIIYMYGYGVEKDYDKAKEWFEKAADLENSEAMLGLGLLYYEGKLGEKDYKKALEWFDKAAGLGSESAEKYAKQIRLDFNNLPPFPWL